MARTLITRGDAVWHTLRRVGFAVTAAVVSTLAICLAVYGFDQRVMLEAGVVVRVSLLIAAVVSAILTAALSYSSAVVMQQLELARGELWRMARTDQLTGILNRRGFDDTAVSAVRVAAAADSQISILMCDIDRFKAINDRFGHEAGDRVLVALAALMRSFAQAHGGIVARHGGEEFVVLLVGVDPDRSLILAEGLRASCDRTVHFGREAVAVSISVGLATSRGECQLARLMRDADSALYAAKRRGRNQVARSALIAA
jgi:diguanylate cyclase (GGDEF)-like protein